MCVNYTINFNEYPNGTVVKAGSYVKNEWFEAFGISLSASRGRGDMPRIFDSSNPVKDPDLGTPNEKCIPPGPGVGVGGAPNMPGKNCKALGNVLIIQERNKDPSMPDDQKDGGTITFNFTRTAQYVYAIGLMDIEGHDTFITVVHQGGTSTIHVIGLGDNSVQTVLISLKFVFRITINFATSGAVTDLACCL